MGIAAVGHHLERPADCEGQAEHRQPAPQPEAGHCQRGARCAEPLVGWGQRVAERLRNAVDDNNDATRRSTAHQQTSRRADEQTASSRRAKRAEEKCDTNNNNEDRCWEHRSSPPPPGRVHPSVKLPNPSRLTRPLELERAAADCLQWGPAAAAAHRPPRPETVRQPAEHRTHLQSQVMSWRAAAIPMDNLYCSCRSVQRTHLQSGRVGHGLCNKQLQLLCKVPTAADSSARSPRRRHCLGRGGHQWRRRAKALAESRWQQWRRRANFMTGSGSTGQGDCRGPGRH